MNNQLGIEMNDLDEDEVYEQNINREVDEYEDTNKHQEENCMLNNTIKGENFIEYLNNNTSFLEGIHRHEDTYEDTC